MIPGAGMSDTPPPLLSARELAPLLGLAGKHAYQTISTWHREGRFPAAIDEPNFVRFDLAEVREALAKRAKAKAKRSRGPW